MRFPLKQSHFSLLSRWVFLYFFGMGSLGYGKSINTVLFDVFGTCVELTSSLEKQVSNWSQSQAISLDEAAFVAGWIEDHSIAVEEVRQGKLPWMTIDEIHVRGLRRLLPKFLPHSTQISETMLSEVNHFWHRLTPWSDVVEGMNRLHSRFQLGTLSNGNEELLKDLSLLGGLPWDLFFAGDKVKHYKPDPEVYQFAQKKLALAPEEILLVASHEYDLRAAKKLGWKTALVRRVEEIIRDRPPFSEDRKTFDYVADSFIELAELLGV